MLGLDQAYLGAATSRVEAADTGKVVTPAETRYARCGNVIS